MKKCLELNPRHQYGHINLGSLSVQQNQLEDALQHFARADALGANNADLCINRGAAHAMLNRELEDLDDFQSAVKLKPHSIGAQTALATLSLCAYYSGNYDEAIEHTNAALSVNAASDQALIALGIAYSGKGLYEESARCFDSLFAINPRHPRAYFYRAMSRKREGDQQGSAEDLRKSKELGFRLDFSQ